MRVDREDGVVVMSLVRMKDGLRIGDKRGRLCRKRTGVVSVLTGGKRDGGSWEGESGVRGRKRNICAAA